MKDAKQYEKKTVTLSDMKGFSVRVDEFLCYFLKIEIFYPSNEKIHKPKPRLCLKWIKRH